MGLGLAICTQLVRLMDSELRIDSTRQQGSRFAFMLTLHRSTAGDVYTKSEYLPSKQYASLCNHLGHNESVIALHGGDKQSNVNNG